MTAPIVYPPRYSQQHKNTFSEGLYVLYGKMCPAMAFASNFATYFCKTAGSYISITRERYLILIPHFAAHRGARCKNNRKFDYLHKFTWHIIPTQVKLPEFWVKTVKCYPGGQKLTLFYQYLTYRQKCSTIVFSMPGAIL